MIITIIALVIQLTKKKALATKEKWSPFECGFNNINPVHIPFSFQFFLVALLFLIFDVEIAIILSYPIERITTKRIISIFILMTILSIGLLYEWQKRKINWSKWMGICFLARNLCLNTPTLNLA